MNQQLIRIRRKHGAKIRAILLITFTVLSFVLYLAADHDLSVLVTVSIVLMVVSMLGALLLA